MDSSNSVPYVLGTFQVDLTKITPVERREILVAAIEQCKPLKYFPGFTPIRDLFDWQRGDHCRVTSDETLVKFPLAMDRQGKLRSLQRMKRQARPHPIKGGTLVENQHQELMLDLDGRMYLWTETLCREVSEGMLLPAGMFRTKDTVEVVTVQAIDDIELEGLLTPQIIRGILDDLARAADDDARKRADRLRSVQRMTRGLQGMRDRCTLCSNDDGDDIPF